eukprot:TRINITY_DN88227_c0_g1_i1.p1 TRINITY_DN88227_c0_g1~~TRINITY_DN88227_c0_g1_i1.p1  ORF type:complete len:632 (+),score=107.76 TRINITY_DN88227_c0_g1_i1:89-1984(+)
MQLSELGAFRLNSLKGALVEQHEQVISMIEGVLACEETVGFGASAAIVVKFAEKVDLEDPAHVEPVIDYQQSQSMYLSNEHTPEDIPVANERNDDDDNLETSFLQLVPVDAPMGSEVKHAAEEAGLDVPEGRTEEPEEPLEQEIVHASSSMQSMRAMRSKSSMKWDTSNFELKEKAMAMSAERKTRRLSISGFSVASASADCASAIRKAVQHRFFDMSVAFSVVGNAVLLGIQAQLAADNRSAVIPEVFQRLEYFFTAIYMLELLCRFLADGLSFLSPLKRYVRWNYFDIMCVSSSILGLILDGLSVEEKRADLVSTVNRFAHIGRVVRTLRVLKFVTQLRAIVGTLWSAVSSMFWAVTLMGFVMYIFAVIITEAALAHSLQHAGTDVADSLNRHFGSVPLAIYTLYKSVTNGNSWEIGAEVLKHIHPMYFYLYIIWVSVILFAFMNVITGFICEQAFATVQRDKEMAVEAQVRQKEVYTQKFAELFGTMDNYGTGELTVDELERHIGDDTVKAYFEHLDLDIDKAWDIFRLLDIDESGTVSLEEFVVGCLKLRGAARSMDLAIIGYDFQRVAEKLSEFMEFVELQLIHMNRASGGSNRRFSVQMNSDVMSRRSFITGRKTVIGPVGTDDS